MSGHQNSSRRQKGFTLMEFMTVVAIAGILLGIGVPSFARLVKAMRIEANTNQFIATLNTARAEALRSGQVVTLTATAGGGTGNEWGKGLSITRAGTTDAVMTVEAFPTTFDSVGNDSAYVFNAGGILDGGDTIRVCDDRTGEVGREITILITGVVDVQTYVCP